VDNHGKKIVLGLLYSPVSFRTATAFLGNIPLEKSSEVIFCPLNIEGKAFKKVYEPKVGFYNEAVMVFWLGLFDEEMMLGRLRLGDASIWHEISVLT
jgi:hypothetical protein